MAKLYWRYKRNGKWTWKPVKMGDDLSDFLTNLQDALIEVEEE